MTVIRTDSLKQILGANLVVIFILTMLSYWKGHGDGVAYENNKVIRYVGTCKEAK